METCLDREVDNIRAIQERMRETLDIANSQLDNNVRKQVQLQEDLDNKDTALDIDKICFQLRNNSKAVLPSILISIISQFYFKIIFLTESTNPLAEHRAAARGGEYRRCRLGARVLAEVQLQEQAIAHTFVPPPP